METSTHIDILSILALETIGASATVLVAVGAFDAVDTVDRVLLHVDVVLDLSVDKLLLLLVGRGAVDRVV